MTATGSPATPELRPWPQRVLLAAAIGFAAAAIAIVANWIEYREQVSAYDPQYRTREALQWLHEGMGAFRAKHNHWPATMDELGLDMANQAHEWRDEWNRLFLFELGNEKPAIVSLGRDGKPGGTGPDQDLIAGEPRQPQPKATLSEFLFHQRSDLMTGTCLMAGGLVFLLSLYLTRIPRSTPFSIAQLVFCFLFTVIVAVAMSAFHIPQPIYNNH